MLFDGCAQFQPDPFDTKGRFSGTGSFGTTNPDKETDGNYRFESAFVACVP
jgi:hypothetical protein